MTTTTTQGGDRLRAGGIAGRMLGVVLLLSLAALSVAAIGLGAVLNYGAHVHAMEAAAERAITGERINGLINAVVMDSRGIYMSRSAAEIEKFAPPLLANLDRLAEQMRAWEALLPAGRQSELAEGRAQLGKFIELRRQMVKAGRGEGAAAADAIGNNDANRATRQALNQVIVKLAAANAGELDTLVDGLDHYRNLVITLLLAIGGGGTLLAAALAVGFTVWGITRPLGRMVDAMRHLADATSRSASPAPQGATRSAAWRGRWKCSATTRWKTPASPNSRRRSSTRPRSASARRCWTWRRTSKPRPRAPWR